MNNTLFYCTDHDYHWPVGVASVVVAPSIEAARALLDSQLVCRGLKPSATKPYTLKPIDIAVAQAIVLVDGNY